jgi:hypothetical protein
VAKPSKHQVDISDPAGDASGVADISRGTPFTYIVVIFPLNRSQETSRDTLPIRTLARHKLKCEDSESAPMGIDISTRSKRGGLPLPLGIFISVCVFSVSVSKCHGWG